MSLFATLSQGDIWSMQGGISFASPINDILDHETFTLEELLREEELLQEVKARNPKLLEFLSQDEVVTQMIEFIIQPAEEGADELRKFKYPYMSCEVFCSEILEVLQVLVEGSDGKHFSKLFSFLDLEPPLDHHLAGYFEKVSELLFRRMTVPVMRYVNTQGMKLLQSFLRHMDNYSIMQIVQRLLLPHIPFSITAETESMSPADAQNYQCNWSYSEETCNLLCARMLGHGNVDVPSHISDLLITVLQLSPAEALILSHLCRRPCVEAIISASIVDNADTASAGDTPTSVQSVSLAAISVLESMVLRLGESTGPFTDENRPTSPEEQQVQQQIRDNLETFLTCLQPFLPAINDQLRLYASTQPCGMLMGQTKTPYPRLGHRGLQLVKFVESLVRLSNTNFDIQLCESGVIRSATDLIFVYDLNSILHLSIQRIVLMIIEGGPARRMIQQHLLVDCGMLQRVIDRIERQINEATASSHPNSYTRVPSLGHLIHIVQVLHLNFSNEHFNAAVRQEEEELMEKFSAASLHSSEAPMTEGSSSIEASNGDKSDSKNNTSESQAADKAPTTTSAETDSAAASATEAREEVASEYPTTVSIHSILEGAGLLDTWQDFVQTLVQYLESQASFQGGEGDYEGVGNNAQMDMALQRLQNQMGSGGSWSVKEYSEQNNQFQFDEIDDEDDEDEDEDDDRGLHQNSAPVESDTATEQLSTEQLSFDANFDAGFDANFDAGFDAMPPSFADFGQIQTSPKPPSPGSGSDQPFVVASFDAFPDVGLDLISALAEGEPRLDP